MFCPKCSSQSVVKCRGGFLEMGEFDGDYHEQEGDVDGYFCTGCKTVFFIPWWDIPEDFLFSNGEE